jgi:hypothetical protein
MNYEKISRSAAGPCDGCSKRPELDVNVEIDTVFSSSFELTVSADPTAGIPRQNYPSVSNPGSHWQHSSQEAQEPLRPSRSP